jgi:general secretion pathway protein D
MRLPRHVLLAAVLLLGALAANAQVAPKADATPPGTVPISSLIATVAQKTGKKFVLDPRVRASVTLIGEDPSSVTYDQLLTILDTYGFTAIERGGYVRVVPLALVRMEPLPFVSGDEKRPDDEDVTAVIHVKSLPAGWLVPILRPLVPQWGHFAAMPCDNSLVIIDSFANVRRLESIIKALDTGAPIKSPSCVVPMPRPWQSDGPLPPAPPPHRPAP